MPNRLILGIAKIGDLLLNNHITQTEDDQDIYDIQMQIPEYQRPYKWTAKNANQLFDDRTITEADSPMTLLSILADRIMPLPAELIAANAKQDTIDKVDEETGIYQNYLHYFDVNGFRRT